MRAMFAVLAVACWRSALAQPPLSVEQLPEWTQQRWVVLSEARALQVSTRMNPFAWRGDFDGDGRQDFALFVRASKSGKEGIAVLFRGSTAPVVIGAGTALGNGGDDFSWLDFWSIVEADARPAHDPKAQAADRLLVAKDGAASALILLENGKPRWRQEGD